MNKKYTLSELLSQCCSASVGITEEQQAWLDMRPIGREVISIREKPPILCLFVPQTKI